MRIKQWTSLLMAGLFISLPAAAENYQWDSVAMGGGGFVSGIIPSKTEAGLVYARTDVGGAYRWDKTNSRWVSLLDWVSEGETGLQGVESLAVDPNNAANVYMLTGTSYFNSGKTAILRSSNYGKTFAMSEVTSQFKAHGNGMGRQSGEKLQVDPGSGNVLYVGTRRNGLFKSTDSGVTWTNLASFPVTTTPNDNGISFVLLDPTSISGGVAQRIYVGVSRFGSVGPNLYFSADAGTTFNPVKGVPSNLMPQRAIITSNRLLYITYANGAGPHWLSSSEPMDQGQIWKYSTVGGIWSNVTPANVNNAFGGISVDPSNPKHLVASTVNTWGFQYGSAYGDQIFTSMDGGKTWVNVVARGFALDTQGINWISGGSIHWAGSIEFDPFDTKSVWVASGNGIFKTSNIDATPATWGFAVAGLEETVPLNAVSVPNGSLVSTIGDYDGFIQNSPSQYGSIHNPRMGSTTGLAVAAQATNVMARVGNAIYYSTNSGSSWSQSPVINGASGQLALSADGAVLLHSPSGSTASYRSTNYGVSWTPITGLNVKNARPVADPINPNKFYVYDDVNGLLMASADGGASFATKASLPPYGATLIRVAPEREGDIWVCLNSAGLMHSTDSGVSFSKIAGVQCSAVGFGKTAPNATYPTLYVWGSLGGNSGVLRSIDQGATWARVNDDAHEYGGLANGRFVTGDMNTYGVVYMSTAGRGIAYGKPSSNGDVTVEILMPVQTAAPAKCEYIANPYSSPWYGGYNAIIRITNTSNSVIAGWNVKWTYNDQSSAQYSWGVIMTGANPTYTATNDRNLSWNNSDIWPGGSVQFGFTVFDNNWSWAGSAPTSLPSVTGSVLTGTTAVGSLCQ